MRRACSLYCDQNFEQRAAEHASVRLCCPSRESERQPFADWVSRAFSRFFATIRRRRSTARWLLIVFGASGFVSALCGFNFEASSPGSPSPSCAGTRSWLIIPRIHRAGASVRLSRTAARTIEPSSWQARVRPASGLRRPRSHADGAAVRCPREGATAQGRCDPCVGYAARR